MSRNPAVATPYARLVLQSGRVEAAALLHGSGLSREDIAQGEFIDASALTVLFNNYDRLVNDPTWPAQLGAQLNVASHGPLGFAALSAPTLGEALDVMGELHACRNTALRTHARANDTHYCIEMYDSAGNPKLHRWIVEVLAKIVELLLAAILGHPVGRNVQINLTRPQPAHAAALQACYDGCVRYAQPVDSVAVPLAWRQLPSPLHDEAVYRINLIKCRELIAAREQSDSVAQAVRNRLINHFDAQTLGNGEPSPPPTLEQVARTMHLTPRTLLRRLEKEQVTYREMLERLRRDYAVRLLRDARLTVADVGERLGYREPANFGRAFKRWYGTSPASWRRQAD